MSAKKITLILIVIFGSMLNTVAQTPMILWEKGAPGAVGNTPEDIPTLTPYFAPKDTATGAAIVICPGGGYEHLADVTEGKEVAKWLNSLGISAFVLKYRLGTRYHQPAPLQDVSRALRLVRSHAQAWDLDANRIGILGFSAGGHLASTLATHYEAGKPDAVDQIERVSPRPDLQILLYPVITMGDFTHAGSKKNLLGDNPSAELIKSYSNELQVTKNTPPAFIAGTVDDSIVPIENSLLYVAALRAAKIPFELHLYEQGPHGYGLAPTNPVLASWTDRCADWLALYNFAKKNTAIAK